MPEIVLSINDSSKVDRVRDAMKGIYPIPTDEEGNPTYTDGDWIKKCLINFVIQTVYRHESRVAKESLNIEKDQSLVE